MFSDTLIHQATAVLEQARAAGVCLFAAESCTGGLVASVLTEISGASDVMLGGVVTYANAAKMELLGVPEPLLVQHGAVSEVVARAMSEGAVLVARHLVPEEAQRLLVVAVTGIAGPTGGSADKPVGTVHLVAQHYPSGCLLHEKASFHGDRHSIRQQAVAHALTLLQRLLTEISK